MVVCCRVGLFRCSTSDCKWIQLLFVSQRLAEAVLAGEYSHRVLGRPHRQLTAAPDHKWPGLP